MDFRPFGASCGTGGAIDILSEIGPISSFWSLICQALFNTSEFASMIQIKN